VAGTQREVLVWLGMRQELGVHDKQRKAMAVNLQCAARCLLASKLSACPFSRSISDFLSLSGLFRGIDAVVGLMPSNCAVLNLRYVHSPVVAALPTCQLCGKMLQERG
jgi:hypothetical protein